MTDILQAELERCWRGIFTALASGSEVPPAIRLRAEGMMEAAVLLGMAGAGEVTAAMERCYRAAFGHDIAAACGADWRTFFPFPQIPAMGRRAPVYPSAPE